MGWVEKRSSTLEGKSPQLEFPMSLGTDTLPICKFVSKKAQPLRGREQILLSNQCSIYHSYK